jgi:hypothetical protein
VIASRLDTPRQIVSKWRKRFAFARLPGLEAGVRPAFPPVSLFRLRPSPASFLTPSGSCLGSSWRKSASTGTRDFAFVDPLENGWEVLPRLGHLEVVEHTSVRLVISFRMNRVLPVGAELLSTGLESSDALDTL